MRSPIVIIGLGQLGAVFAHGFLRTGRPVMPVTRELSIRETAVEVPRPDLALVAVGEADLEAVLSELPDAWRDRIGLLQNEMLPPDWEKHDIVEPTVIAVWFEKKRTTAITEIVPSPVAGPRAHLVSEALAALGLRTRHVDDITDDLILKNLYILVANIAGLETGGTVGALWTEHNGLVSALSEEILQIQSALAGRQVDVAGMIEALGDTFLADPDHGTRGRSAPARLARALAHANRLGLGVPELRRIATDHTA
ncbi:MAG: hypothetical protein HKN01_05000 [Acidimicrobiia bacterium]|nr:hypothetical protein [Acidimicrobiia bacterium]